MIVGLTLYDNEGQLSFLEPIVEWKAGNTAPRGRRMTTAAELISIPYQYCDLTPGHGNLLGDAYWELRSPVLEDGTILNTGAAPRDPVYSSLASVLEERPARKYYLSRTACLGILRRAEEREKALPSQLEAALRAQAGSAPFPSVKGTDSGGKHLFAAAFSAGAGATAGSIAYSEQVTPTLKGSPSGNSMPSVLCLNDQGGAVMECSENITGTLRAQEHGYQPLVFNTNSPDHRSGGRFDAAHPIPATFETAGVNAPPSGGNRVNASPKRLVYENHGIDARYTGPHRIVPTLSARAGTGGNNLPLVAEKMEEEDAPIVCITGNAIDRQPLNGGNGLGISEDGIAFTLTATDRHAVFSRQRADAFKASDIVSTESARQHKDATDLVYQDNARQIDQDRLAADKPLLIRRLTPLECERLQGFPDGWTDVPGAADSARYKALGNSVAIPCVEFILAGITAAIQGAV